MINGPAFLGWFKDRFTWALGELVNLLMWFISKMQDWGDVVLNGVLGTVAEQFPDTAFLQQYPVYLGNINYFFPLSEVVTMVIALASLHAVVFGYRLVKSWIPSVSS